jgi:hypothetical protein
MLKLRNYLYFFLTRKKILKSGIFLSNFFIVKYNKAYIVNIYIYHIDFEKLSFSCINRLYASFFSYNRRKKIRKAGNFFKLLTFNVDFFFYIILFYKVIYKAREKKRKLFIKSNLFLKFSDFSRYYNKLLVAYNRLLALRIFKKEKINTFKLKEGFMLFKQLEVARKLGYGRGDDKNENLESVKLNKSSIALLKLAKKEFNKIKLEKKHEYNMLYYYNNRLLQNKYYQSLNYKDSKLKFNHLINKDLGFKYNFTLLEFIFYLLKGAGLNFKNSIFSKVLKLSRVLSFLPVFKHLNFRLLKQKINYNFLSFFLTVLLKSVLSYTLKKKNYNKIRAKVYFLLYSHLGYKFFFKEIKAVTPFLSHIFFIINKARNVSYKIFFLSNKNITARWLCRYIGIKLRNNYSFYSVINPIKKELYKLCRLNKKKNRSKMYFLNIFINRKNFKYKLRFKNFMKNFFFAGLRENFLYYINNSNYIYDWYLYFNNKAHKGLGIFSLRSFLKLFKHIYVNIFLNCY